MLSILYLVAVFGFPFVSKILHLASRFIPTMVSPETSITKVLLVGANGTLGSVILKALLQAESFEISLLLRSTDQLPPAATSARNILISPELSPNELVDACTGQDAVIAAFQIHDVSHHLRLVEAAYLAGVRRYIPADFGSCESSNLEAQKYFPMYGKKILIRETFEGLAEKAVSEGKPFTWTSIVNGHFFDYGLEDKLLHFNLDTHVAHLLDGGNIRASTTTLPRVAETVVRILQRPNDTRNRALYVQSFCPTQLEILSALERATGVKWRTEHLDSKQYLDQNSKLLVTDYDKASFGIVFVLGTIYADWRQHKGFAMKVLELEDENLDTVVTAVVAKHKTQVKE